MKSLKQEQSVRSMCEQLHIPYDQSYDEGQVIALCECANLIGEILDNDGLDGTDLEGVCWLEGPVGSKNTVTIRLRYISVMLTDGKPRLLSACMQKASKFSVKYKRRDQLEFTFAFELTPHKTK